MMKHVFAILAAIGLIWAFAPDHGNAVKPVVPSSPVSIALRTASKEDRSRVASFYDAFADVVDRSKLITTAEGFRRVHANSLDEAFKGTDLQHKYIGLDVAIDDTLAAAIGKDNTGLDGENGKRAALVKALRKVASDAR